MANQESQLNELSREQILDLADAAGRKLGFLLATSAFDDDVKNALLHILDEATPAQIDALSRLLEEGYLSAQNKAMDEFLKNELAVIKAEYDHHQSSLEKDVLLKLDDVSKRLR